MRVSPVEVTTRYVTTVPELTDAFAFVMDRIDTCGADPMVSIRPTWRFDDNGDSTRFFEVTVEGMKEQD